MWWEKLSNPRLHQIESNYAVHSFHVGFQVMNSEPLVTLGTLASQLLMNRNVVNLQLCRRLETFPTPVLCTCVSFPLFSVLVLHVTVQPFDILATHWADFCLSMHHLLVHFSESKDGNASGVPTITKEVTTITKDVAPITKFF